MGLRHVISIVALVATGLLLVACGANLTETATSSPSAAAGSTPQVQCTVEAILPVIQAALETSETKVSLPPSGGEILCTGGYARLTVVLGPKNPPANGPGGALHLALLEDQGGRWVVANDVLCVLGQPVKPLPARLGTVCGVQ